MQNRVGCTIQAFGKSMHAGQTGLVVRDWDNMLLILADDQSYANAHRNTVGEGKYFVVDSLLAKLTSMPEQPNE